MATLLALLLAYIPSADSLLKHTAARARALRTREVTLTGTLSVSGEAQRTAQLVIRFPLQCRFEGEGGLSLSVKGTAQAPEGVAEGTAGPALRLLQLACPFIAWRGVPAADAPQTLKLAALAAGANPGAGTSLSRFDDRVAYVLGAGARDTAVPQLWIYKDSFAPARLIAQGGADLRLLEYGNPAAAEWFPRVIELWTSGHLAARFEALEAKGVRGTPQQEEEEDSDE
ncbi:MAG TPA: hypothetical protein VMK66_20675 [Myxococcales bacterium]|nr:hypothetical protein [Myxococcales bacterium]